MFLCCAPVKGLFIIACISKVCVSISSVQYVIINNRYSISLDTIGVGTAAAVIEAAGYITEQCV